MKTRFSFKKFRSMLSSELGQAWYHPCIHLIQYLGVRGSFDSDRTDHPLSKSDFSKNIMDTKMTTSSVSSQTSFSAWLSIIGRAFFKVFKERSESTDRSSLLWRSLGAATMLNLCLALPARAQIASTDFVTTWQTTTANEIVRIPTLWWFGFSYNFDVDWNNDGVFDDLGVGASGIVSHTYASPGMHTIRIRGDFPTIYFLASNDLTKEQILSVDQWGAIAWESMEYAFIGAENLTINASDAPDLSRVTTLNRMFQSCTNLDGDLSNWDVSTITNMESTFASSGFNNNSINNWNVSNVEDMSNTFNASQFNQPLNNWNVHKVKTMHGMFSNSAFNQDIGNWNVGACEDFQNMFLRSVFNQDIGNWNVSSGTIFNYMFDYSAFNQDIGNWNVSSGISFVRMFSNADFDQNLSNWDLKNLGGVSLHGMFEGTTLSQANYEALLINFASQWRDILQLPGGGHDLRSPSYYCSAAAISARATLQGNAKMALQTDIMQCPIPIEFSTPTASDLESAGGNLPSLSLDGTLNVDMPLDLIIGGTATPGLDYSLGGLSSPGTITVIIPSGTYSSGTSLPLTSLNLSGGGSINFSIIDDVLIEAAEMIDIVLDSSPSGGILLLDDVDGDFTVQNSHSYSILPDDAEFSVSAVDAVHLEGNSGNVSFTFEVARAGYLAGVASVDYTISGSGPNPASVEDFGGTFPSGTINFPGTVATQNLVVDVVGDILIESNESFTVTLSNPSGATLGSSSTSQGTINNDDVAGSVDVNLSVSQHGDEEGSVPIELTATLVGVSNSTGAAITFDLLETGGTAVGGDDFSSVATLVIPNGSNTGIATLAVSDDNLLENDETVEFTIANPSDPVINIVTATVNATLSDNDNGVGANTAIITSIDAIAGETGNDSGILEVDLGVENSLGLDITVSYSVGGTATPSMDYTALSGTLIVSDGQQNATIDVTGIIDDALFENDETVEIILTSVSHPAIIVDTTPATVFITDNDNGAGSYTATISTTDAIANETGVDFGAFEVDLGIMNNTGGNITVSYNIGGTATPTDDYTALSGSVEISDGQQTATIDVSGVIDDLLFENDETVEITLTSTSDPAVGVDTTLEIVSITDNDNAVGSINADLSVNQTGNESGQALEFIVTLSNANNTGSTITFDITQSSGTATSADYTNVTTISVADGSSTGIVSYVIIDDGLFENDESFEATISNASDPAISINTASASGNILDNDNAPGSYTATVLANDNSASETSSDPGQFTVDLGVMNHTGSAIMLNYDVNGTAIGGFDYSALTGSVTVPNGQQTALIDITGIVDDVLFENDETVVVALTGTSDGAVTVDFTPTMVTILDNDNGVGSISAVLSKTQDGDESGPALEFTVTLGNINNTGSAISFDINQSNGTATASDYTNVTSISVANGSSTGVASYAVTDDGLFENDESFVGTISNASDPAIGITTASAAGSIIDNDNGAGSISAVLSKTQDGDESGHALEFTVTLGNVNNTGSAITFDITQSSGTATVADYANVTSISVADGSSTGVASYAVTDDGLFENDESFEGTISNASDPAINITTASAAGSIIDNDNGAGSISAVLSKTQDGDETGPTDLEFTVTLGNVNNTGSTITFDITQSSGTATAADYTNVTSISVADGSSTGVASYVITDDGLFENDESFEGTISNASDPAIGIITASATGTIIDNDNGAGSISAVLSKTQDGDESGPTLEFTVTLGNVNNTGSAITFDINQSNGTATAVDYTNVTSISVADGSSTGVASYVITDDGLFENDESFEGTISNASDPAINITTASVTGSIIDNDNGAGSISAVLSKTQDGDENGPALEFTVTLGNVNNTGSAITFDITQSSGTATSADYTNVTSISVADGLSTGVASYAVIDDGLFENDESFEGTISNASDPAINITTASAAGSIIDNDNGAGSISAVLSKSQDGDESGPALEFTVTLGNVNNTGSAITFDINQSNGTATAADYTNVTSISVADGSNTGVASYVITDDGLFENDESFEGTISNASDPAINITTASATGTIIDNDNGPGSISAALSKTQDGDESGPALEFTVTLGNVNNTGSTITFDIAQSSGTATAADYTNVTSISVADGSSTGVASYVIIDDGLFENDESFEGTISNASDAAINITTASATGSIVDNDNGTSSINAVLSKAQDGDESGPALEFTVTLGNVNNTGSAITFDINQSNGTATAMDYTNVTSISVADGSSTGVASYVITDDGLFENDESFEGTISNASDAAINITTASATGTIIDNDNGAGSISAVLSKTQDGDESGPTLEFTVTLGNVNNTGSAITFDINQSNGTATAVDYTNVTSISVADGSSTGVASYVITDDGLFENDESFEGTISNASDPAIGIITASATGTIIDNDNGAGSISAVLSKTQDGDESGPALEFTVTLGNVNNTGSAISFDINQSNGTATASDYTNVTSISVANGSSTGVASYAVIDDGLFENDESFEGTISNASDPAINITTVSAAGTIIDNDNGAGSISAVLSKSQDGDESGPALEFTVTLGNVNNTGSAISFDINQSNGTATAADYTNVTSISVADGSSTGVASYVITDDGLFENDESFEGTISNASDPAINITTASATGTIIDNDNGAGSISAVLSKTQDGDENGLALEFTVTLGNVNNTGSAITFDINQSNGTATAADYTNVTTISVADGSSTGVASYVITDDGLFENDESFEGTISNASDLAIGITTTSATGTIVDNDNGAGSISAVLSKTRDGDENGLALEFTVTLSTVNNTGGPISFDLAQSSGTATTADYNNVASVSVMDGSNTGVASYVVVNDELLENDESFEGTISNASDPAISLTTTSATGMIVDNDNGAGSINADLTVSQQGDEQGQTAIVFMVTIEKENGTGAPITFDVSRKGGTAISNLDYDAIPSGATIAVPHGTNSGVMELNVMEDLVFEVTETLEAEISDPSDPAIAIRQADAMANLYDNDLAEVSFSASPTTASESGGIPVILTATLPLVNVTGQDLSFDVSVSGTATSGEDYVAFEGSQAMVIPNNSISGTIIVNLINDVLIEERESLEVTFSNPGQPFTTIVNSSLLVLLEDEDADADLDGDGVTGREEDIDGDGDPTNDDSDEDGIPNYLDDDDDGDGISTSDEDLDGDGDPSNEDSDGDGMPNYLDPDDDGDGVPTAEEDTNGDGNARNDDQDNDGIPDYLDDDNDNDGASGMAEDADGDGDTTNDDIDGDGIPNYQDPDDDGDGIPSSEEDINGNGDLTDDDTDGDGIPNFLDPDDDGDMVITSMELEDNAGNIGEYDFDGDGIPDHLDADDDNDGLIGYEEDRNGNGNLLDDDCNQNGLPDFKDEASCDLMVMPNLFSPNGDGQNDLWVIPGIEAYPNNRVAIFNRFGNKVYQATGYNNQDVVWDGTAQEGLIFNQDKNRSGDTYFYIIELSDQSPMLKGFVMIRK